MDRKFLQQSDTNMILVEVSNSSKSVESLPGAVLTTTKQTRIPRFGRFKALIWPLVTHHFTVL